MEKWWPDVMIPEPHENGDLANKWSYRAIRPLSPAIAIKGWLVLFPIT